MSLTLAEKLKTTFLKIGLIWVLCVVFNLITLLFIYFKLHPSDTTLALHYNVLVGVEWYGKGKNLYLIPGVGAAITAVNFIFYKAAKERRDFYAPLTVFVSLSAQIILLASALFLARVN